MVKYIMKSHEEKLSTTTQIKHVLEGLDIYIKQMGTEINALVDEVTEKRNALVDATSKPKLEQNAFEIRYKMNEATIALQNLRIKYGELNRAVLNTSLHIKQFMYAKDSNEDETIKKFDDLSVTLEGYANCHCDQIEAANLVTQAMIDNADHNILPQLEAKSIVSGLGLFTRKQSQQRLLSGSESQSRCCVIL